MAKVLIVDCLGRVKGKRLSTVDIIGAGPRAVAGVLEKHKMYCTVKPIDEYERILRKFKEYDALFISAMTPDRPAVVKIVKAWRRISKGPIVLGGPIVFGLENLKKLDFDIAVYGEAEKTLEELLEKGLRDCETPEKNVLRSIKGIVFRDHRKIIFTGKRPFLTRKMLNNYQSSAKVILGYEQYWAYRVYVEILRGCSNFHRPIIKLSGKVSCIRCYNCSKGNLKLRLKCPLNIPPGCGYCSVPSLYGPPRSKDIDNVIEEIKALIRYGVTRITLSCSDILEYGRELLVEPYPLTDPKYPPPNLSYLRKLFERIFNIPEVSSGEIIITLENIKASLMNEEAAKLLGEFFKNTPIHIGCETGSMFHAKLIGRPSMPKEVVNAIKLLKKYELRPYVYFIHGLPGQSNKTVSETLRIMDELEKIGVEKITTYRFTPLPGTAFEKFPPGKPITKDKLGRQIVERAKKINIKYKETIIGKRVDAIVVNPYHKDRRFNIAYPILHGPVILIKNSEKYYGFRVKVRIVRIVSERVVEGEIVNIVRKVLPGTTVY